MYGKYQEFLRLELEGIEKDGLLKNERIITTPQGAAISVSTGEEVLNFCANNYLGLSSHPEVVAGAQAGLDERGYGMSSVRFICGTQDIHRQLEKTVADFLHMDDCILYSSCFDANGGLFETLFKAEDAIISDTLNHASIIDGIRLCKAKRYRFAHADMADLEAKLVEARAAGARFVVVATDGVFSMDGDIARLDELCDVAERHDALVMVDDSHATGFLGAHGRGSHEHCGVLGRIDIITSTLGKAMGGASGGFTAARQEIVDILRQRSRPYLFSNSVPPVIAAAALAAFRMINKTTELRDRLEENSVHFRTQMRAAGFDVPEGVHPIVPIMLGDARLSQDMARDLLNEGIYVIGFFYPVVPKGKARIRVQLSAAHTREQIDSAIAAFTKVGRAYGVVD